MTRQTGHPRLLYLVKQFSREATDLATVGDDLSAMKAIVFLDLSIEQMRHVLIGVCHAAAHGAQHSASGALGVFF